MYNMIKSLTLLLGFIYTPIHIKVTKIPFAYAKVLKIRMIFVFFFPPNEDKMLKCQLFFFQNRKSQKFLDIKMFCFDSGIFF